MRWTTSSRTRNIMETQTLPSTDAPPAFMWRDGQKLSYEELRDEVAEAVEEYDGTQSDIARRLDVSRAAVSRATREDGATLASLQRRILKLLRPNYKLEEEVTVRFRVIREDDE